VDGIGRLVRRGDGTDQGNMPVDFNPPPPMSENQVESRTNYRTWMCLICGWVYDEAAGLPDEGIPPGTRWEDVPINWTCPECGARKEDFEMTEI
jgi:rubredoxin